MNIDIYRTGAFGFRDVARKNLTFSNSTSIPSKCFVAVIATTLSLTKCRYDVAGRMHRPNEETNSLKKS